MWLVLQRRLLTNGERARRGISTNVDCYRCMGINEDTLHVLGDCKHTKELWKNIVEPKDWGKFFKMNLKDWLYWNLINGHGALKSNWNIFFSISCWKIWQRRNEHIFEGKDTTNNGLLARINVVFSCAGAKENGGDANIINQSMTKRGTQWKAPDESWVKLNVDGAASSIKGQAGCGGVCRDTKGNVLFGFMHNIGRGDPLQAELWGCLIGLKVAWDKGTRMLILETDSIEVKELLENHMVDLHEDASLIQETISLLNREWEVAISHVPREVNNIADILAKSALSLAPGLHEFRNPPLAILDGLEEGNLGNLHHPTGVS